MMLYIAEIKISKEPRLLIDEINHMRSWLDHMGYQPIGFRQMVDRPLCRVDFMDEFQAREFASAFSGQVLPASAG
jgi:hypothetical protein